MANKNPEQRAATRRKIMDAYTALFKERPDGSVTASAVIQAASVNRSTFYDYFDSVADLQRAVEDDLLAAIAETARAAIVSGADLDIIALVSRTYTDHGELIGLMIGEHGSASFIARIKESLKPLVIRVLPGGTSENELAYVAEFVTSGLISLYALWFSREKDIPLEELAPFARSLVFSCLERREAPVEGAGDLINAAR
ncbi:TetR/AcrR family transcriptional regulator [Adlercreutzia sp. R21]|uniref:TetR/AcrR family transcriptional regulator n=1 Tax=Adlercreutzia wanghongyangiae TaxID=3111451 RepID=UPI002DBB0659|nr:TetR/AcrR family transcriptional regulator [Adlercreutzia sp. R21]MEC4184835.1 TetR/AcrR family transcriptional regulator [Adlercreutzia sp. R21]